MRRRARSCTQHGGTAGSHQDEQVRGEKALWPLRKSAGGVRPGATRMRVSRGAQEPVPGLGHDGPQAGKSTINAGVRTAREVFGQPAGEALRRLDACSGGNDAVCEKGTTGNRMEGCAGSGCRQLEDGTASGTDIGADEEPDTQTKNASGRTCVRSTNGKPADGFRADERGWSGGAVWSGGKGAGFCDLACAKRLS